MIPELGHFALILALGLALVQAVIPLWGSFNGSRTWMEMARPLAWGQLTFLLLAFACLLQAFLTDDFSVLYVSQHSNSLLPQIYKVSALWGGHEGSLLLWVLMLGLWGAAVAAFSRNLPLPMISRVIAVQGMVAIGFLLFTLLTSNPFERIFPIPPEGRDLNPLLQDFGSRRPPAHALHGLRGLLGGLRLRHRGPDRRQAGRGLGALVRPWTTVAWIFLTIGIALGSWWAYYELGWGGWWFWDPVENASFMPWLVGTALMHSLAVTEKRGAFKSWTVLLAISAFSLSLLGTFLVRSGVLTSVHAFATDPSRGTFILAFLVIVIGGSLALYAWRAPAVSGGGRFDLFSRESFLLINNLLLAALAIMVLFGTLAPLIYEAAGWGKISVGFPWFNTMFIAISPFLVLAMGIGPLTRWKHDEPARLLRGLWVAFALSLAVLVLASTRLIIPGNLYVGLGLGLAAWLVLSHLINLRERLRNKGGFRALAADLRNRNRSYYGMWLAHIGIAMFIVGATMVSNFGTETDLRMSPGDVHEVAGYRFQFNGAQPTPDPTTGPSGVSS
jgi:cytochrome c-type biogenesis protein CcmF